MQTDDDVNSLGSLSMDAVTHVPTPANEPVRAYAPGSQDRTSIEAKIKELAGAQVDLTMTIGGAQRLGGGEPLDAVEPHNHGHVLGRMHEATGDDVAAAVAA